MAKLAFVLPLLLVLSLVCLSSSSDSDPQRELEECRRECQQRPQGQQHHCQEECERRYREQRRGRGERDPIEKQSGKGQDNPERESEQEGETEQERKNPYHFRDERYRERIRTEHGYVKVLDKFTEQSDLLRGIENYRVSLLEADPHAFVMPVHFDAEGILYVNRGRGTITLLQQENKKTYNLEQGDIIRVPAGTTFYLTNRDNNQKLQIVELLQAVSTPGRYEAFYGPSGKNPESFFRTFSDSIVKAAFNSQGDTLRRLFEKQTKGAIFKAREEQIREISRHASSRGSGTPFKGESSGPVNLLRHGPAYSNQYGKLYEVDENDYPHLRELDISVGFANITSGAMTAPYYNSKATKVAVVTEGNGYFEMVCPHLASGGRRQKGQGTEERYQKIRGNLSPGHVVVVPAGHPTVIVASRGRNLEVACFNINARNNERYHLAGKNNIYKNLEEQELELSFNAPSKEVKKVLNAQDDQVFTRGPEGGEEGGRGSE
ncbi:vicilin Cor a 11.0101-like [Aristolochia californica]|uniref:vicilin Cor a 11.0101-like n=1 Tax=Aristolochia californica TaxID=171875 RepID=UPI0035E1BF4D